MKERTKKKKSNKGNPNCPVLMLLLAETLSVLSALLQGSPSTTGICSVGLEGWAGPLGVGRPIGDNVVDPTPPCRDSS